jgi:renalase
MTHYDIAVIGAGLAGLTCGKQLQERGQRVIVLDKSRGVGGRVATRRLHDTKADHGLPYWENQGELSQGILQTLQQQGVVKLWLEQVEELNAGELTSAPQKAYIAEDGMNAIAKYLAQDLTLLKQHRVTQIQGDSTWQLSHTASDETLSADIVILAIPAPQAYDLLHPLPLSLDWLSQLKSVTYNPCLTLMAGYTSSFNLPWRALRVQHSDLAWIALDSSKRPLDAPPVFVYHSTPEFAQQYLEATELDPAGKYLLAVAEDLLGVGFASPNWFQVHRWRYATPREPLSASFLATQTPLPLICCGDWCGGTGIESALQSGELAAQQVQRWLE